MLAAVLLGIAEMEQETRRERQRARIELAKKGGQISGTQAWYAEGKTRECIETEKYGTYRRTDWQVARNLSKFGLSIASMFPSIDERFASSTSRAIRGH